MLFPGQRRTPQYLDNLVRQKPLALGTRSAHQPDESEEDAQDDGQAAEGRAYGSRVRGVAFRE